MSRVVLHVGLHKTGTTYLQSLLRANRRRLRQAGVYLPKGRQRRLVFAALDLTGRELRGVHETRIAGAWDRTAGEVDGCGLPVAVVSEERLSVASARQAKRAVESFSADEVHVVMTVRDPARVLVSAWQEEVKNGQTWTFAEYAAKVRDPLAVASNPARGFWVRQDLAAILNIWGSAVPADRMHLVTVPPAGSDRTLLARRFGDVVGFGPDDVPTEPDWDNENTGAVGTELLRRLNERLGDRLNAREYDRGVKGPLVRMLSELSGKQPTVLGPADSEWATERAEQIIADVSRRGYRVVGDLTDLVPKAVGGDRERGQQVDDSALLGASLDALAVLSARQGELLARFGGATADSAGSDGATSLAMAARTLGFKGQRAAADLLDRSAVGRRAAAYYLRRRAR